MRSAHACVRPVVPGMPVGHIYRPGAQSCRRSGKPRTFGSSSFIVSCSDPLPPRSVSRGVSRRAAGTSLAGVAVAVVCSDHGDAAGTRMNRFPPRQARMEPCAARRGHVTGRRRRQPISQCRMKWSREPRASGLVSFESASIVAGSAQSMVAIPLRRTAVHSWSRHAVQWEVESGSARPNIDYQCRCRRRLSDSTTARRLAACSFHCYAPVRAIDPRPPRSFSVALREVGGGARLGAVTRITVAIVPQVSSATSGEQLARSQYPGS